jgi:dolichyl-phosphate-mannose-protein mannosyltransferase
VWGRLRDLGFPPKRMFDEIYFPVFASNYLEGERFFDLHPPLGKFIIAASIALFGDDPVGWRLMPAVFGCATVGLGALLGWSLTKSRVGALLVATFLALETMLVAYSRTGVMDGFLVFFVLAAFLAALRARSGSQVIWVAVLLGLAISVKWAALPVAVPAGYVLWRRGLLRPFVASLWISAVLYVAIVFAERLVLSGGEPWRAWQDVWTWHIQAADKITAAIPNPWTSPWWSWPLMLHPIRFFFGATATGEVRVISAIGNPLLWWSSTLAVIAAPLELARRWLVRGEPIADDPLVPALLGYVFLLVPWIPGTRLPYIYNYLPSYAFAILVLACLLVALWGRRRTWGAWAVVVLTALSLAAGLYYLPMAAGVPMSPEALQQHVWIESWFNPNGSAG